MVYVDILLAWEMPMSCLALFLISGEAILLLVKGIWHHIQAYGHAGTKIPRSVAGQQVHR